MRMKIYGKVLQLAMCGAVGAASIVAAAEFVLRDGSTIKGTLTSSSNGACIITRNGGQTFPLNCEEILRADPSPAPSYLPESTRLRIAGSNTIGAKLMPALLSDYVKSKGASETPDIPRSVGPDEVVIDPRPVVANLWNSVEVSAHGSASGFQALASLAINLQPDEANRSGLDAIANAPADEASIQFPRPVVARLWSSIEANAGGSATGSQNMAASTGNHQLDDGSRHGLIVFAKGETPADIAMSSRHVTTDEVAALKSLGALDNPISEHVIALDGLAIVINRANRVETLSREQIKQVFTGKITDWDQVGGWPGPISLYARKDGSGTLDTFKDIVLKGTVMSPNAIRIEDSRELSSAVAKDVHAIGFIGMSYVGEAKAVNIRECNLVYPPTIFNAKTEEYPLARRLFLYAPERRTKGIDDFLNYTNTAAAQRVVAKNGFVDLSIEPDFIGDQRRLRQTTYPSSRQRNHDNDLYEDMIRDGGRLSITLRFRTNSADISKLDLDSRAIHDLQRLKDYMLGPQGVGRKLRLVGFTDSDGDYKRNRVLSFDRANSIANQLQDVSISGIVGLGPSFPVACNDSDEGKAKNRRVEVTYHAG